MKNLHIALLLILSIIIWRCTKEQDSVLYTITSSSSVGGTIDPIGKTILKAGDSISYIIKPTLNYSIKAIIVDGIEQPVSNVYKFKNVSSDGEIKVEFQSKNILIDIFCDSGD